MKHNVDNKILHEKEKQQFSYTSDGHTSYIKYSMVKANEIDFYSTFTHPAMRGQGIAARMTEVALQFAEENGYTIHASCWYVAKFLEEKRK